MRKPLLIVGAIVGVTIVVVAAVLIYALANLNSIIAQNRDFLLARASNALGRQVEVSEIKAQLGWGVSADLTGVKIADDDRFSQQPFVSASDVYVNLEVIPLLSKQIRVTKVVLKEPQIRIIQAANGQVNVSTIGKKSETPEPEENRGEKRPGRGTQHQSPLNEAPEKSAKAALLSGIEVHNFAIDSGKIAYEAEGRQPVAVSHIDLEVTGLSLSSPFDLSLTMAAFGDDQNIKIKGQAGPLARDGRVETNEVPIELSLKVGPFALSQIRKLEFAKSIPDKLQVSDEVSLDATVKGKLNALVIHGSTDLTSNQVAFGDAFQKPAGTPLKADIDASRDGSTVGISQAKIVLSDLDLTATKIKFGEGNLRGRIDTNRFDIASLSMLAPSAAKAGVTGKAEIHSDVAYEGGRPSANGVVTLASVTVPRSGAGGAAVSDLNGDVKLAGDSADVGPLAFKLGSGRATLKAHAERVYPPKASYEFSADSLKTSDFAPNRPPDEQLLQVEANGNFSLVDGVISDDNKLTSLSGSLNNISYRDLRLVTSLAGKRLRVSQLMMVGVFGGSISGSGEANLIAGGPFDAAITMTNLNLQQALESQKAKAAGVVRGLLSGKVQISGKNNGDFDAIKPTLSGSGQAQIAQGQLVGVNIAEKVLAKTQNLPVIGSLVPPSIANNHPELFKSSNTDFQQMGLTFVIEGPRITSHDLVMRTVDYALNGDGWFDMDKNIDLTARILLTPQFSREIIEQKKNVVYLANNNGQVDIPLRITGQLPKPIIVPDIGELAQRASQSAVQEQGTKALSKVLGNKGLGKFLGGVGSGSGGGKNSGNNPSSNPLDQLKGLFGR